MASALEIDDLRIWVASGTGPLLVVDGLDLVVEAGSVHGVAGESGSGKSLSAMAIMGLLPKDMVQEGSIRLAGRELTSLSSTQRRLVRGSHVSMIFQDPMTSLHPMLTVGRQLTEHLRGANGLSKASARARARDLLAEVRIPDPNWALGAYPHQFSGGMRQRISIAMALSGEPEVLIADEPTTALDVTVQAGILHLLKRLCAERGLALVLITHDLGVIASMADSLSMLYAGRKIESGPAHRVMQSPRHPYTDRLLKTLPRGDPSKDASPLATIPGDAATPDNRPSGCAFHPRCRYRQSSCSESIPTLIEVATGHKVACPVDPLADEVSLC